MATTASPYGVKVISDQSGTLRSQRIPFGIANGLASNIFKGQVVMMNATTGTITPITNPGGTPDPLYGVFTGCQYTPTGGRPTFSPFWPSGMVYTTNEQMFAYITPLWLPNIRLQVQADGAVAQTALGAQFLLNSLSSGSTFTGLSTCSVSATPVAAASQGQLTLVEFATDPGDSIGDAFTDLIFTVAYPQIGPAGQASIG